MAKPTEFASVLDTPIEDIERPKPIPVGSYVCMVKGQPRIDKSKNKGTEFSEFTLQILEPCNDVDENELEEMGGIQEKTIRATFYHTAASAYRLKDFLSHCGVEFASGATVRQLIAEAAGKSVIAHVKHDIQSDGRIFLNVDSTAPVS